MEVHPLSCIYGVGGNLRNYSLLLFSVGKLFDPCVLIKIYKLLSEVKWFQHVLPFLEVDAWPFLHFPAQPGQNIVATGLELSLALCSSKMSSLLYATKDHNTVKF
jgi:hypothetical protein